MKFIPKVGEECFIFDGLGNVKATPSFVGKEVVVYSDDSGERVSEIKYCSPIKSPAEIEREEAVNDMQSIISLNGMSGVVSMSAANRLYDAGYRKQQVKPLSYEGFRSIIEGRNRLISEWYDELKPYTIQGGDK